jgi:hypothetical protein
MMGKENIHILPTVSVNTDYISPITKGKCPATSVRVLYDTDVAKDEIDEYRHLFEDILDMQFSAKEADITHQKLHKELYKQMSSGLQSDAKVWVNVAGLDERAYEVALTASLVALQSPESRELLTVYTTVDTDGEGQYKELPLSPDPNLSEYSVELLSIIRNESPESITALVEETCPPGSERSGHRGKIQYHLDCLTDCGLVEFEQNGVRKKPVPSQAGKLWTSLGLLPRPADGLQSESSTNN